MIYLSFELDKTNYYVLPTKLEDLEDMKVIRDQCLEYIHDNRSYPYVDMVSWFLTKNIRYLSVFSNTHDNMIGYFRLSDFKNNSCYVGMDLDENYRGKGIAVAIYNAVIDHLNNFGITDFYLRVLQSNVHAVKLYKSLGFEILSNRENVTKRNGKTIGDFLMLLKKSKQKIKISDDKKQRISKIIKTLNVRTKEI